MSLNQALGGPETGQTTGRFRSSDGRAGRRGHCCNDRLQMARVTPDRDMNFGRVAVRQMLGHHGNDPHPQVVAMG